MDREWEREPNEDHFTHAGLACHIFRQSKGGGHLCGYVELPPESTWNQLESVQWDSPAQVHGGITFGIGPLRQVPDGRQYVGFDCAHAWDISPNYFDQWGRFDPDARYRNIDYVRAETMRLAEQVRASIPVTAANS